MSRFLHRVLRRMLLPRGFVERHGEAMEAVFLEAMADADGVRGRIALWGSELLDLTRTGWRLAGTRPGGPGGRWRTTTGGWTMRGGVDDLRQAIRSLVRNRTFSVFVILTVSIGVGATTAIYSALDAVLLNPIPYANADRMVSLWRPSGSVLLSPTSEQLEAWAGFDDVFEAIAVTSSRTMTLEGDGEPAVVQAALIRPSFHELTGRSPLLGRPFTDTEVESDARVILLGHGTWQSRFGGGSDALGRTLRLDGEDWTVVGVMPPRSPMLPRGTNQAEIWRPLRPGGSGLASALLREGVTLEMAHSRLEVPIEGADGTEYVGGARSIVESVGALIRGPLRLLMASVVAVLLIAGLNVSNLLLGRTHLRRSETAVRYALGAGRGRLVRQFVGEGVLLGLLGGALGVGLAYVGLEVLLALRPPRLEALDAATMNTRVLAFAGAATVVTSLCFSVIPALRATRPGGRGRPVAGGRRPVDGPAEGRARWLLVLTEVSVSFALVVVSILLIGSLLGLQRTDPGFAASEVIAVDVHLPSWRYASGEAASPVLDAVRDRLAGLPGVAAASRAIGPPPSAGIAFGPVGVDGQELEAGPRELAVTFVDAEYFRTVGQSLSAGGPLEPQQTLREDPVVILGESAATTFFGGEEPLGRRFRIGDDEWRTVVGVAEDVAMQGLTVTEPLQMYLPMDSRYGLHGTILVRAAAGASATRELLPVIREAARTVAPEARLEGLGTLADRLSGTVARERFTTTLLVLFASLAVLLAMIGLYGVVAQTVGQRTREIGIRMALGATRTSVRGLVLQAGARTTAAGILVGSLITWAALRVLSGTLFGLDEAGGMEYTLSALLIVIGTLIATWIPARRATRVDPVRAMRVE